MKTGRGSKGGGDQRGSRPPELDRSWAPQVEHRSGRPRRLLGRSWAELKPQDGATQHLVWLPGQLRSAPAQQSQSTHVRQRNKKVRKSKGERSEPPAAELQQADVKPRAPPRPQPPSPRNPAAAWPTASPTPTAAPSTDRRTIS